MSTSNTEADGDDTKVVLEQTLLKTEEVFVYRIPPMLTAGGHNASNWDLANPAATCSLHVLRRDSSLLIKLLAEKPKVNGPPGATEKYLFAQSSITLDISSSSQSPSLSMSHWIEAVVDSSRYFVIRISDEKRKKEAHIGMGFRERNDAVNFKMSLQDYENTMRKEAMVHHHEKDQEDQEGEKDAEGAKDGDEGGTSTQSTSEDGDALEGVSKLSLKEGEKIHINLKGSATKSRPKKTQSGSTSTPNSKPPMLLRKPPPPATGTDKARPSTTSSTSSSIVVDTNSLNLSNSKDDERKGRDMSSVAAVAEMEDDDDDEWGDFESPTFEE